MSLPILYKGAAPGTHWHANDARLTGFFVPPMGKHTFNAIITHITNYSTPPSPYMSFSMSFAVAKDYALLGLSGPASTTQPGYVYEIDLSQIDPIPTWYNPIEEISKAPGPSHKHNGNSNLLNGIIGLNVSVLTTQVPTIGGRPQLPVVNPELQALVYALRDSEVLLTSVNRACITRRVDVY